MFVFLPFLCFVSPKVCLCPPRTGVQEIVRHKGSITYVPIDNPPYHTTTPSPAPPKPSAHVPVITPYVHLASD